MRRHYARNGFTLIELMIVIAIIAILAAILIPNYTHARAQGIVTACKSNLKSIATATEMYGSDNVGRYPTNISQLNPQYLKAIPTCPSIGATTYSKGFVTVSNPDAFTIYCSGNNHGGVGDSSNYPQYTSAQGLLEH